jgi:hypothetical protein
LHRLEEGHDGSCVGKDNVSSIWEDVSNFDEIFRCVVAVACGKSGAGTLSSYRLAESSCFRLSSSTVWIVLFAEPRYAHTRHVPEVKSSMSILTALLFSFVSVAVSSKDIKGKPNAQSLIDVFARCNCVFWLFSEPAIRLKILGRAFFLADSLRQLACAVGFRRV